MSASAALRGALKGALVVAYPALVYVGLTRWGTRAVALAVLDAAAPRLVAALRAGDASLRRLAAVPALTALLAVAASVTRDRRLLLALPTLINLGFCATFAASLRSLPVAERFARMQVSDLSPAEVAYCRAVTVAWCGFFVLNGSVAAALALWAPLRWWTVYTGALAYALIGLLFAVEYLVRVSRFGRLGDGPVDRLLARVLPAPTVRP